MKTSLRFTTVAAASFLAVAGSVAGASAASADGFRQIRNAAFTQCVDAPSGGLKLNPCSTAN